MVVWVIEVVVLGDLYLVLVDIVGDDCVCWG